MRDENRSSRGNSYGKRNFGSRDSSSVTMHKVICDSCGKSCEVPFRPSNNKPVYCNECFGGKKNYEGNDRRLNERVSNSDRQMYSAICDECGNKCEVPFKPSNNKPIYCSDCFEDKGNVSEHGRDIKINIKSELEEINKKLDILLKQVKQ